MNLKIVTAASEEPVGVPEMKAASRITTSSEDAYIATVLTAALGEAQGYTWSQFIAETRDAYYDDFNQLQHLLPYPPLVSVTSVSYVDTDGDTQTVSTDVWESATELDVGLVRLKYNQQWPTDVQSHKDVVIVRFVCGYGAAAAVPQDIKQAIIVHAQAAYLHRDEQTVPPAFYRKLGKYSYRSFKPPFWGAIA